MDGLSSSLKFLVQQASGLYGQRAWFSSMHAEQYKS